VSEQVTGPYRVGRHQPQNVYRHEQYIGVMLSAADAALVVLSLNQGTLAAACRQTPMFCTCDQGALSRTHRSYCPVPST
jgi:hypothetical protein